MVFGDEYSTIAKGESCGCNTGHSTTGSASTCDSDGTVGSGSTAGSGGTVSGGDSERSGSETIWGTRLFTRGVGWVRGTESSIRGSIEWIIWLI